MTIVTNPLEMCPVNESKMLAKPLPSPIFNIPPVDQWVPAPEDEIVKTTKNSVNIPFTKMFNIQDEEFDNFIVSTKRCYNGKDMRYHIPQYLNYFEKFYDIDHELLMIYYNIKFMIDYQAEYDLDMFKFDITRYIFKSTLALKAEIMV